MRRRALLAAIAAVLAGGVPGDMLRPAAADEVDDLLSQLMSVKDAKALKPIEDRLRLAVKPEHVNKLLAELSPLNPLTTPLLLDLIGTHADGPSTVPTLKLFVKPEPAWFAARVLAALARLGDGTALPRLGERAEDGTLKPQDRNEYVSAICALAVRDSDENRQSALSALARLRLKEGLGALLDGLTDSVSENRRIALRGLQGTLESLYPYLRFSFEELGYDPTGGTDEARRKATESLRTLLASAGLPHDLLKSIKLPKAIPKTQTPDR